MQTLITSIADLNIKMNCCKNDSYYLSRTPKFAMNLDTAYLS